MRKVIVALLVTTLLLCGCSQTTADANQGCSIVETCD